MKKTAGPLLRLVEELVGLRLSGLFSDPKRETDELAERGGWKPVRLMVVYGGWLALS